MILTLASLFGAGMLPMLPVTWMVSTTKHVASVRAV